MPPPIVPIQILLFTSSEMDPALGFNKPWLSLRELNFSPSQTEIPPSLLPRYTNPLLSTNATQKLLLHNPEFKS